MRPCMASAKTHLLPLASRDMSCQSHFWRKRPVTTSTCADDTEHMHGVALAVGHKKVLFRGGEAAGLDVMLLGVKHLCLHYTGRRRIIERENA
eukprot:scaffold9087_cov119-Isochrysis_galbana.AAC.5